MTFRLAFSDDGEKWRPNPTEYRLGNVEANPIPQKVALGRTEHARYIRLESLCTLKDGEPPARTGLTVVPVK